MRKEILEAYLDDALDEAQTAEVEQALRSSADLRQLLRTLLHQRDRGEHSVGAIWRRQRLTCPTREELGSYLLEVLEAGQQDYIAFHLQTIGCAFCRANLEDLQRLQEENPAPAKERRQRYFESSVGYLRK